MKMPSLNKNQQQQPLVALIHTQMKIKGWTLADVANHLGVSYIYVASLSSGARKISGLGIEKQRTLAQFLGISMVEFFVLCGLLREEDLLPNK